MTKMKNATPGILNYIVSFWEILQLELRHENVTDAEFLRYLEREDLTIAKYFMYLLPATKIIETALGAMNMHVILQTGIWVLISGYCVHTKNMLLFKIIIFFFTCLTPFAYSYFSIFQCFRLVTPVLALVLPLICLHVTKSAVLASITFLLNSVFVIFKTRQTLIDEFSPLPGVRELINALVVVCLEVAVLLLITFGSNLKYRTQELQFFFQQKRELAEMAHNYSNLNEELKGAMAAKDRFLMGISHELKNPLNMISGNIELCQMQSQDPQCKDLLDNAKTSCELLGYLMMNLLDAGKLNYRNLVISETVTDIMVFVEKMWATMKTLLQRKELDGQVFIAKDTPQLVLMDQARILQLLYNLVSNSAKFTFKGGITIVFSWLDTDKTFDDKMFGNENFRGTFNNGFNTFAPSSRNAPPVRPSTLMLTDNCDDTKEFRSTRSLNMGPSMQARYKSISYLNMLKDYHKLDLQTLHVDLMNLSKVRKESFNGQIGYLRIDVVDTGSGMPEEQANSFCDNISSVNPEEGYKQLGLGVGLLISHNLCKAMGGGMKIYSKINEGTSVVAMMKCSTTPQLAYARSQRDTGIMETISFKKS
jgi:signal transduction histidine kinase